jgi:PAS domain S-box-containing protein
VYQASGKREKGREVKKGDMAKRREAQLREQITTLEQRVSHLEQVIKVSQMLNTTLNLDPLLKIITEAVQELTQTEGCSILLLDRETGALRFQVATGRTGDQLKGLPVPLESSIAGYVLRENKPVLIHDVQEDARFFKEVDETFGFETRSLAGVPLQVKGQVIGVLEAVNKKGDQVMSWADVDVLAVLADQAAVAIENAHLYDDIRRIKEFNEDLVQSMAEGIVVTDADRRITFVNPAAATLLGYTVEELVGRRWTSITPPDQRPIASAANGRRVHGQTDRYELELMRKDSQRVPVLVSGSPRFDADTGHFAGTMAVFTDITQLVAHQRVEQELALAGQMQASFLPEELPDIPGWQLVATLEPARQTSGDFYDLIPLPEGRWGVLIADVADKGTGAALYMAVCRTLIRSFAAEYDVQPERAFNAANRRILTETHADLFVTAFYGVLDPANGTLTYCNAGHNPPFLFSAPEGDIVRALGRTGLPLGAFKNMDWERRTVEFAPGDVLMLYTDGITDAENALGTFFGQEKLLEVVQANLARSAQGIQQALMTAVHAFVGSAPQFDDIALMVLIRDS